MTGWSAEDVDALGRYIDKGLSAGETARLMRGRSRAALLGKAHRMGWVFGQPRTEAEKRHPNLKAAALLCARRRASALRGTRPVRERQVTALFDDDTFAEIVRRAKADKTSRAQVVRELVEWGLEAGLP